MTKRKNNNGITKAMAELALTKGMEMVPYAGPILKQITPYITKEVSKRIRAYTESALIAHPGGLPGALAAPVAISRRVANKKPRFSSSKGEITVQHRELITAPQNTTGALQVNNGLVHLGGNSVYEVNPMNGRLFTWLPSIAANFEEYRINSLSFCYIPSCATTEVGRFVQYWDKDATDPLPTDRQELSAYQHMSSCAPWAEDKFTLRGDAKWRYCIDAASPTTFGNDPQLVDYGQYGFAVYGGAGTNIIGDVYVDYNVSFREPQPTQELVAHAFATATGTITVEGPPNIAAYSATANSITVNLLGPGSFMINMSCLSTAAGAITTTGISSISSVISNNGTTTVSYALVISPGFTVSSVVFPTLTALGAWNVYVQRTDKRFSIV